MLSLHPKIIRFIINLLRSFGGEIINKGATIAISILIVQQLGQQGYGQLSLIMSVVFLMSIVSDMGINRLIIRDAPVDTSSTPQYVTQLMTIKTVGFVLIGGLFLRFRGGDGSLSYLLVSYLVFGYGTNIIEITKTVLRAHQHIQQEGIIKLRSALINTIPLIGVRLLYQQYGFEQLGHAYIISGIISILVGYYYLITHYYLSYSSGLTTFHTSIVNGSPFLVSAILNYCYSEISLIIIQYQGGSEAVGLYAVGYRIMVYGCLLIDIITQVTFKQCSDEYHQHQSYRTMYLMLGVISALTITGLILTILGGQILIPMIYGSAFEQVGLLLIGFSIASIFIGVNFVYGTLLIIQHHNRDRIIIQTIIACIHITTTRYGMHRFGLPGAVAGLCISQLLMMLGYMILFYLSREYSRPSHHTKPTILANDLHQNEVL